MTLRERLRADALRSIERDREYGNVPADDLLKVLDMLDEVEETLITLASEISLVQEDFADPAGVAELEVERMTAVAREALALLRKEES